MRQSNGLVHVYYHIVFWPERLAGRKLAVRVPTRTVGSPKLGPNTLHLAKAQDFLKLSW
jgi:hypothetical protein